MPHPFQIFIFLPVNHKLFVTNIFSVRDDYNDPSASKARKTLYIHVASDLHMRPGTETSLRSLAAAHKGKPSYFPCQQPPVSCVKQRVP